VLELLAGETGHAYDEAPRAAILLAPRLAELLAAVENGHGTLGELVDEPEDARAALAGLGELERLGLIRRGFAGRWERRVSA
jgi:DNA processing protein